MAEPCRSMCLDGSVPTDCDANYCPGGLCPVECEGGGHPAGCDPSNCPPAPCSVRCEGGLVPADCDPSQCGKEGCIPPEQGCDPAREEWSPGTCKCECTDSSSCGCSGKYVTGEGGGCVCYSEKDHTSCGKGKEYRDGGCCRCVEAGKECGNKPGYHLDSDCICKCDRRGQSCRTKGLEVIGTLSDTCYCRPNCQYPYTYSKMLGGHEVFGHNDKDCRFIQDYVVGGSCKTRDGVPGTTTRDGGCKANCTPRAGCTTDAGVPGERDKNCVCMPDCGPGNRCRGDDDPYFWDSKCNCVRRYDCTPYNACGPNKHYDAECNCVSDCVREDIYDSHGVHGIRHENCTETWDCGFNEYCEVDGVAGSRNSSCRCIAGCTPNTKCNADPQVDKKFGANCSCNCASAPSDCGEGRHVDTNTCACACDEPRKTCQDGYHFEEGDCDCHCDLEGQLCGESEDDNRVYDKYCNCSACSGTEREICQANAEKGAVWHDEPDCRCDCEGADEPCSITRSGSPYSGISSSGGNGHYDDHCNCTCEPGDSCWFGYAEGSGTGTFDDGCDCKCSVGGSCTFRDSTMDLTYGGHFGPDCRCRCIPNTACSYRYSGGVAEGKFNNSCECQCVKGGECLYNGTDIGKFDGSCECTCVKGNRCSGYTDPDGNYGSGIYKEDCTCTCDKTAECTFAYGGQQYTGKYDEGCHCKCVPQSECTYVDAYGNSGSGHFDDDCKCTCDKDSDCTTSTGAMGHYDANCNCTMCSERKDCKNGGTWIEYGESSDDCRCDCSTASCSEGDGGELDPDSDTCACKCADGWHGTYPECWKDQCPAGKQHCDKDNECYATGQEYCEKCDGGCYDGECHTDAQYSECDGKCWEVDTEEWCTNCLGSDHEWCSIPAGYVADAACFEKNTSSWCKFCKGGCWDSSSSECHVGDQYACEHCKSNGCWGSDSQCHVVGESCGCDGGTRQSDCSCSKPEVDSACGCKDRGKIRQDCSCSEKSVGDSCGTNMHVNDDCDCVCDDGYENCGGTCYRKGTEDWCTACKGSGYEWCGNPAACRAKDTEDWCTSCKSGGCWEAASSACHVDDQYACEHCGLAGCSESCWYKSACRCVGGTCGCGGEGEIQSGCKCSEPEVGDECGECETGTVQDDCSCSGKGPGDDCETSAGKDGKYSEDCSCGCHDGETDCLAKGSPHFWDDQECFCSCDNFDPMCEDLYHEWSYVTCTCDCVGLPHNAGELCTNSGGEWNELDCDCDCGETRELDESGKCVCKDAEAREETCKKYNPTGWNSSDCTCNCGDKREWNGSDCVCKDRNEAERKCKEQGREFDDKTCDCGCKTDDETRAIAKLCDRPENKYASWNKTTCQCDCEGDRKYIMSPVGYDGKCQCSGKKWDAPIEECQAQAALGKQWNNVDCTCYCADPYKKGNCKVGDYSKGEIERCECKCPPGVVGKQGDCGPGYTLDSSCNCKCTDPKFAAGASCTIVDENDGVLESACGRCKCTATASTPCKIDDKVARVKRNGHKDPTSCACVCSDSEIGQPCTIINDDGSTAAGKVNSECQCACAAYKERCTAPGIPYGQLNEFCECVCLPQGTRCRRDDDTFGTIVNDPATGKCDCVCDPKKELECEAKAELDLDRSGIPKPWSWNASGCYCECLDANLPCSYVDADGVTHEGVISEDTCDCEACTRQDCTFPAMYDEDRCKCTCEAYEALAGKCIEKGKYRSPDHECQCVCDKDISDTACKARGHLGDPDTDYLVPAKKECKCVCNNAGEECTLPNGGTGRKDRDTCECKCDKKAVKATCKPGRQEFDEDNCKCKCATTKCTDGQRQWDRKEPDCECACTETKSCLNGGEWIGYKEDGTGCRCNCPSVEDLGLNPDYWILDEVCKPHCVLTASGCDRPADYNPADCDCNACDEEKCKATPKTPNLDEETCTCVCDESAHDTTCKGDKRLKWSREDCACISACPNCAKTADHNLDCEYCDCAADAWKPRTSGGWYDVRDQYLANIRRRQDELTSATDRLQYGTVVCPMIESYKATSIGAACAYCKDRESTCYMEAVTKAMKECDARSAKVTAAISQARACAATLASCYSEVLSLPCGSKMPTAKCSCSVPTGLAAEIDSALSAVSTLNDLSVYLTAWWWDDYVCDRYCPTE